MRIVSRVTPNIHKLTAVAATIAVTSALVVGACSGGTADGDDKSAKGGTQNTAGAPDRTEAIRSIARDVILPGLESSATTIGALDRSISKLCAGPDNASLTAARDGWIAAESAWAGTTAFRFGPTAKLRSVAAIGYPINTNKIDKMFAAGGEFATTAPSIEAVAKLGADKRGLGAIEYLLFASGDFADDSTGGDATGGPATGGDAFPSGSTKQRCAFMEAAAQNVAEAAGELLDAWHRGSPELKLPAPFFEQFTDPGSGSMYKDQQDVLNDVVNSLLSALTSVGDMVLGPATGKTTSSADPASVDSGAAHRKLDDARSALESVQRLYGDDGQRLSGVVGQQSGKTGNNADAKFRSALADAQSALEKVSVPIAEISPTDAASGPLVDAFGAVDKARVTLRTEIASQLGVTISFSDSDGDG